MQMNRNLTIDKAIRWWEKGTQPNISLCKTIDKLIIIGS
jgi:hypothetical protein